MPVILSQHFSPLDRPYQDAEFSLYHYPRVYFSRIRNFDRFIYYRPRGKSERRIDSKHYFGHGVLGQQYEDPYDPSHRFVDLIRTEAFREPVPIYDALGRYFETESATSPQWQAAVRDLSETAYYKILAAADVRAATFSALPNTNELVTYDAPLQRMPKDPLREILRIPPGAGYVPSGTPIANVHESAALQERARADHQNALDAIQSQVIRRGGMTWYNNNIDLFARVGDDCYLIEAKSLHSIRDSVDRMRYGIGQLADYRFRYRPEIGEPVSVLAFATRPTRDVAWISEVLDDQRIAFVHARDGHVSALNEIARGIAILT